MVLLLRNRTFCHGDGAAQVANVRRHDIL